MEQARPNRRQHISIAGNIGVGKSTLVGILAEEDDTAWSTVTSKKAKRKNTDPEDGAVKPVGLKATSQPTEISTTSNGTYSLLASDEADGWTVA